VLPYVWAEGGDLFTADRKKFALNEPAAIKGLERIVRQYKDGLMPQDTITANADAITRWFVNGPGRDAPGLRGGGPEHAKGRRHPLRSVVAADRRPEPQADHRVQVEYRGIATPSKLVEPSWTFLKFLRGPAGEGETLYMQAKRMARPWPTTSTGRCTPTRPSSPR